MIRILIIAILVVVLYRLVVGQPVLGSGGNQKRNAIHDHDSDFVDYEEIDEDRDKR